MYITINQALNVWTELLQAYFGDPEEDGNFCTIQLQQLMEYHHPDIPPPDIFYTRARIALRALIDRLYSEFSDVTIIDTTTNSYPDLDSGTCWTLGIIRLEELPE